MIRGYLELVRPANVVTALADVLAGFAVAGLGHPAALPWLLLSTAGLYAGGITLNDVFDRRIDAIERPERPIPSGRVSVGAAGTLGGTLLALGVLAAAHASAGSALVAAAIATAVLIYDGLAKRHAIAGPINMGLCRALNLLLGVSAVPAAVASEWPIAVIPFVYVTAITALSRGEVRGGSSRTGLVVLSLMAVVLAALAALSLSRPAPSLAALLLTLLLTWRIVPPFWRAHRQGSSMDIRRAVRAGILSLVLVDAVIAAAYADMIYSLAVLATAALAALLARLFPVT